ncbi:hypothetical protein [Enterococcus cecorum]|uniref:hypothetical protein n=1 Tax=Enterococcus cecorum TaxID=44008 RepID=UPI003262EB44
MKRRKVSKLFGVASLLALFGVGALLFTNGVEAKEEDSGESKVKVEEPVKLTFKKIMDGTAGYKPVDGDKFTFTFRQLTGEEAEKYWPGLKVTPSPTHDIKDIVINGKNAKETVSENEKTVEVKYSLSDLTEPGYYMYEISEKKPDDLGNSVWNYDDTTYILRVTVRTGEDENTITQEATVRKKNAALEDGMEATKETELVFTNSLKEQKKDVFIYKFVQGPDMDVATNPEDYKYTIHVVVTKPNGEHSDEKFSVELSDLLPDSTTSNVEGNYSEAGFDISITDTAKAKMSLPLGTKLEVYEKAPGKRFSVNINPNSKDEADEDSAEYEEMANDQQNSKTVTDYVTSETGDLNSIAVTNKLNSLVNTGVKLVTSPFVVLLAVVAVAFGGYVVVKRRLNVK